MLRDLTGITGIKQRYQSIQRTFDNDNFKVDGKKISGFKSKMTLKGILFIATLNIYLNDYCR